MAKKSSSKHQTSGRKTKTATASKKKQNGKSNGGSLAHAHADEKYVGISQYRMKKWEAHIWAKGGTPEGGKKGKQLHLGYFNTPLSAARTYDLAALFLRGSKASLNFAASDYSEDPIMRELRLCSRDKFLTRLRELTRKMEEKQTTLLLVKTNTKTNSSNMGGQSTQTQTPLTQGRVAPNLARSVMSSPPFGGIVIGGGGGAFGGSMAPTALSSELTSSMNFSSSHDLVSSISSFTHMNNNNRANANSARTTATALSLSMEMEMETDSLSLCTTQQQQQVSRKNKNKNSRWKEVTSRLCGVTKSQQAGRKERGGSSFGPHPVVGMAWFSCEGPGPSSYVQQTNLAGCCGGSAVNPLPVQPQVRSNNFNYHFIHYNQQQQPPPTRMDQNRGSNRNAPTPTPTHSNHGLKRKHSDLSCCTYQGGDWETPPSTPAGANPNPKRTNGWASASERTATTLKGGEAEDIFGSIFGPPIAPSAGMMPPYMEDHATVAHGREDADADAEDDVTLDLVPSHVNVNSEKDINSFESHLFVPNEKDPNQNQSTDDGRTVPVFLDDNDTSLLSSLPPSLLRQSDPPPHPHHPTTAAAAGAFGVRPIVPVPVQVPVMPRSISPMLFIDSYWEPLPLQHQMDLTHLM
jgi:hypothetical protein